MEQKEGFNWKRTKNDDPLLRNIAMKELNHKYFLYTLL